MLFLLCLFCSRFSHVLSHPSMWIRFSAVWRARHREVWPVSFSLCMSQFFSLFSFFLILRLPFFSRDALSWAKTWLCHDLQLETRRKNETQREETGTEKRLNVSLLCKHMCDHVLQYGVEEKKVRYIVSAGVCISSCTAFCSCTPPCKMADRSWSPTIGEFIFYTHTPVLPACFVQRPEHG